jgi:hypothetical protein
MSKEIISIHSSNQKLLTDYLILTELSNDFCISIFNELDIAVQYRDQKTINDIVTGINYRFNYYKINLQVTHKELKSNL